MDGHRISVTATRVAAVADARKVSQPRHDRASRWRIVAVLAMALGAAGLVLGWPSRRDDVVPVHTASSPPDAYYDVRGQTPTAFPDSRLGLAFLRLDEPLQRAVTVLGPPTTGADIMGTAYTWAMPGGAELSVSALPDGPQEISGLYVQVPPGSPTRVAAYGGVVIGQSTLSDVVAAWGRDYTAATSPFDDFVVRYVECVGAYPVVIKFDQTTASDRPALVATPPRWDQPITSFLVAYADEAPGSAGCSV